MNQYQKAKKTLAEKYQIDLLQDIVLSRRDRAIYYVEYGDKIAFTKIHGKSPLDLVSSESSFTLGQVDTMFDMESKYGEVAGKEYYKNLNMNSIQSIEEESNVTIPLMIQNDRYWLRFHLYSTKKNDEGKTILASCYITDVTRYLIHEEELYEKTHKDELTGLFNRYALYYHFTLHGHRTPITSYYFDIDDFKHYNDTYGHKIGDKVLTCFSDKLKDIFSDKFICYRLGGDEFYCLLYESNKDEAKKILTYIQKSMEISSGELESETLSVSIGVVTSKGDVSQKHVPFMEQGDKLMYESKNKGKNTATCGEFKIFETK